MSSLLKQLRETKSFLYTLQNNVNSKQDVLAWFQDLCGKLCDLLLKIAESVRQNGEPMNQIDKETMLLYLLQLNTTLSVLIKIFTTEGDIGITINESRQCILQQIAMCLTGLENVLNSNVVATKNASVGFVKYMDLALDKLTEIDVEGELKLVWTSTENARQVIEEVLCHAMSIAQVALKDDCNVIKGSSKEVLHNFDYLVKELHQPTPRISMCNLFIDAACDKLCALERKVNAAVLKLSLKVFSECAKPLEDLHRFCLRSRQDEAALDEAVADFDLHVDRMIQVGLFAVSCSSDRNCTLRMRSCLASLEALEGELVPALTTLVQDCAVQNLYHAEMLKHYWLRQAGDLKKHIYLIIDPFAFCQVTHEVIRDINAELEERFREVSAVDKSHIKPITLQAKILYEMLLVSLVDSPIENQALIRRYLDDVICVTMEIDAAAEKLLSDGDGEMCKTNVLRVFKRCKVQENILKKLLDALSKSPTSCKAKTVSAPTTPSENIAVEEEQAMEHITTRGKQILRDRSVLYKTPNKAPLNIAVQQLHGRVPQPLSRLLHQRNMQFSHSRSETTSCDLQITDILDNLTLLSASLQQ